MKIREIWAKIFGLNAGDRIKFKGRNETHWFIGTIEKIYENPQLRFAANTKEGWLAVYWTDEILLIRKAKS